MPLATQETRPDLPAEDEQPGGTRVPESVWRRSWSWHAHAPAERLPLTGFVVTWPAAWIAHLASLPVSACLEVTGAVAALVLLIQAARARRQAEAARKAAERGQDEPGPVIHPADATGVTVVTGAWFTLAAAAGPLAHPWGWPSLLYVAGWGVGYRWLRRHPAVLAARQRRDDEAEMLRRKTWWHQIAPRIGLAGFHLQDVTPTLLGEQLLLTSAPGSGLASRIAANGRGICENLEHLLGLEYGRVDISRTGWPGQLLVDIRYEDPAAAASTRHPALDPDSPYAALFPAVATVREPVPLLVQQETGEVHSLRLWTERGGVVIGVYAKVGAGKTTVLDCLRERITVMPDAVLVDVNGAKVADEMAWSPLAGATVAGSVQFDLPAGTAARAMAVLEWLQATVTERTQSLLETGDSVFQPTAADPAIIANFDEIDELVKDPNAKRIIEFIASKGRQASVTLIVATQRAINQWTGGGVKASLYRVLVGVMNRPSETRHATSAEYDIPDIAEYSKGEPGFFQIWDPNAKRVEARGRAFNIGTIGEQQRHIIWRRDPATRPALPGPELDLGLDGENDQSATVEPGRAESSVAAGMRARLAAVRATFTGSHESAPALPPQASPRHPGARVPGVPGHVWARMQPLLEQEQGTTAAEAAAVIGTSKTQAWRYLTVARKNGKAHMTGAGQAARWYLNGGGEPVPEPRPYGTIEQLAEAVVAGRVDVDEEARAMLAQVREIARRSKPRQGGHLTVLPGGDDTEGGDGP